jgi:endonuclease III
LPGQARAAEGAEHSGFRSVGKAPSSRLKRLRSFSFCSRLIARLSVIPAMQLMFELETSPLLPRLRDALLALFGAQPHRGKASPTRIEALIAPVTFAERKARQLPTLIRMIQIRAGGLDLNFLGEKPVEAAMEWLQSLPGVGVKTAAVTLNFSALRGRALVVDTHLHRVVRRLGLVGAKSESAQAYEVLMSLVPAAWTAEDLFELHWLIKGLGQSICSDGAPLCGRCPLKASCPRVGVGVGRKVLDLSEARGRGGR